MPQALLRTPRSDRLAYPVATYAGEVDVDDNDILAEPADDRRDRAAADEVHPCLEGRDDHVRHAPVLGVDREPAVRDEELVVECDRQARDTPDRATSPRNDCTVAGRCYSGQQKATSSGQSEC